MVTHLRTVLGQVFASLGSGIWLGAIVMLGAGVAPKLFGALDKDLAGTINAGIIQQLHGIELVAISMMLLGMMLMYPLKPLWRKFALPGLNLVVVVLYAWRAWNIAPQMEALRSIGESGTPVFDELHELYFAITGIQAGIVFVTVFVALFAPVKSDS